MGKPGNASGLPGFCGSGEAREISPCTMYIVHKMQID